MKKLYFLSFSLILVLILATNAGAADFKDIPRDHWAYNSVKTLVEKGLLSLYEDGTFRGKDKVTRYELAELVARILDNIYNGKGQASKQDLDMLRKLSLEFRNELVDLAKKQEYFIQRIEELKQKNLIQNEDIGKVNEKLIEVENNITQIIDNILVIKQLEEEINSLNSKIEMLEEELNETNNRISDGEEKIIDLKDQLSNSLYQDLEDQQSINLTKIHSLQSEVNELKNQLLTNNTEIEKLKKENENYRMYLMGVAGLVLLSLF